MSIVSCDIDIFRVCMFVRSPKDIVNIVQSYYISNLLSAVLNSGTFKSMLNRIRFLQSCILFFSIS